MAQKAQPSHIVLPQHSAPDTHSLSRADIERSPGRAAVADGPTLMQRCLVRAPSACCAVLGGLRQHTPTAAGHTVRAAALRTPCSPRRLSLLSLQLLIFSQ